MTFLETVEIAHRHANIEVVRARRQNVFAGTGRLVGDNRVDRRVEEQRLQPREHRVDGLAGLERKDSPRRYRSTRGRGKRLGRAFEHELTGRQVVVRTGVQPKQLRIALDLTERCRIDGVGMRDDLFQHVAHGQVVRVALVVIDIASGERRLVQVPDQNLLIEWQRREAVSIQLRHRRIVHSFEQVFAIGRCVRRECGRNRRRLRRVRQRRVLVVSVIHPQLGHLLYLMFNGEFVSW